MCLYLSPLAVSSILASCEGGRSIGCASRAVSSSDASVSRISRAYSVSDDTILVRHGCSTSSKSARALSPSVSTVSRDASIRSGPFSNRTSSAFRRRLGGRPIGRSNASNEAGRFRRRRSLNRGGLVLHQAISPSACLSAACCKSCETSAI